MIYDSYMIQNNKYLTVIEIGDIARLADTLVVCPWNFQREIQHGLQCAGLVGQDSQSLEPGSFFHFLKNQDHFAGLSGTGGDNDQGVSEGIYVLVQIQQNPPAGKGEGFLLCVQGEHCRAAAVQHIAGTAPQKNYVAVRLP